MRVLSVGVCWLVIVALLGQVDSDRMLTLLIPQTNRHLQRRSTDHHFFKDRRSIQNCAVKREDEKTYLAMDRLCEACHEMYRHTDPNIRANCRNNCFDNDDFVFCFTHLAGVQVARGGGT